MSTRPVTSPGPSPRPRNDRRQYDDLAEQWWEPTGGFAMLHWLAVARAALVPPADRAGAVLVDLGCGAGLLSPHIEGKGYVHVGVDLTASALHQARAHGVTVVHGDVKPANIHVSKDGSTRLVDWGLARIVHGDVTAVPLADGCADVVAAGEILEHVTDLRAAVAQACRLLRPGGLLVIDTIAATALARVVAVTLAERMPGGPPPGIHDPALFVDRAELVRECARHGVEVRLRGIRPAAVDLLRFLAGGPTTVRMVPVALTSVLFQAVGRRR